MAQPTRSHGHHRTQPQCNPQLYEKKTKTTHKQVGNLHTTWVGHEFAKFETETTTTYTKKAKSEEVTTSLPI